MAEQTNNQPEESTAATMANWFGSSVAYLWNTLTGNATKDAGKKTIVATSMAARYTAAPLTTSQRFSRPFSQAAYTAGETKTAARTASDAATARADHLTRLNDPAAAQAYKDAVDAGKKARNADVQFERFKTWEPRAKLLGRLGYLAMFGFAGYELIDGYRNHGGWSGVLDAAKNNIGILGGGAAGAYGGTIAGAWVGGIVGSIVPVVGTAAGIWAGGFIGGLIGGYAGGTLAQGVIDNVSNSISQSFTNNGSNTTNAANSGATPGATPTSQTGQTQTPQQTAHQQDGSNDTGATKDTDAPNRPPHTGSTAGNTTTAPATQTAEGDSSTNAPNRPPSSEGLKPSERHRNVLTPPPATTSAQNTPAEPAYVQPVNYAVGPAGYINGRPGVPYGVRGEFVPAATPPVAQQAAAPAAAAPSAKPEPVTTAAVVPVQQEPLAAPAQQPPASSPLPAGMKIEADDLNSYVLARLKVGSAGTPSYRTELFASTQLYSQKLNGNNEWGKQAEGRVNVAMAWTEKPELDLNGKPPVAATASQSVKPAAAPIGPPTKLN